MKNTYWIGFALSRQKAAIDSLMLENYLGDRKKIAKWDDYKFDLCYFNASKSSIFNQNTCRRNFDRLAQRGIITRRKISTSVTYRFNRNICDFFAKKTIRRLKKIGYSQTEILPLIKEIPTVIELVQGVES